MNRTIVVALVAVIIGGISLEAGSSLGSADPLSGKIIAL